jgi:hypothetical protein
MASVNAMVANAANGANVRDIRVLPEPRPNKAKTSMPLFPPPYGTLPAGFVTAVAGTAAPIPFVAEALVSRGVDARARRKSDNRVKRTSLGIYPRCAALPPQRFGYGQAPYGSMGASDWPVRTQELEASFM